MKQWSYPLFSSIICSQIYLSITFYQEKFVACCNIALLYKSNNSHLSTQCKFPLNNNQISIIQNIRFSSHSICINVKLTWRERIVRMNRTAPTTKYLSALRINSNIFSITLLRRKLHLKTAKRTMNIISMLNSKKSTDTAEQQGNTLFCMDDVGHKSIIIHICLIVSPALFHSDTEFFVQDLLICHLHQQYFLKDKMLL